MDDFKSYCKKAHIQVLLLGWITNHLAQRKMSGNSHIDAIEIDFKNYSARYNQNLNFRFDRGDQLLVIASFLVVGGVEAIRRIGCQQTEENVIQFLDQELSEFMTSFVHVKVLKPLNGENDVTNWTLAVRLRNSMSHFRYEYEDDSGRVRLEDIDPKSRAVTADLSMQLFHLLDFAYKFGRACALWAERNGEYPQ